MLRIHKILFLGLAVLGAASAGPIQLQIGGGTNGVNGLTSNYITTNSGSTTGCSAGTCPAWTEQNYNTNLFLGATASGGSTTPDAYGAGNANSTGTYSQSSAATGTMTDTTNNITFAMINDGTGAGGSNNVWVAPTATTAGDSPLITIPVGVFGVESVWTMLNADLASAATSRDAWVVFNFSNSVSYTVKLSNTANSSNSVNGFLQDAVDCTPSTTNCTGAYNGATGSALNGTNGTGSVIPAGITIDTNQLYSFGYTNTSFGSTGGNVVLDDQGFVFSGAVLTESLANTLNNIQIEQVASMSTDPSATVGLSAVTVIASGASATPEPSTVALLVLGMGAILFNRNRRRAS